MAILHPRMVVRISRNCSRDALRRIAFNPTRSSRHMLEVSSHNVWTALAVTLAAGLATGLGSLMVVFAKKPNPRLLAFGLAFAGGAMVYVSLSE